MGETHHWVIMNRYYLRHTVRVPELGLLRCTYFCWCNSNDTIQRCYPLHTNPFHVPLYIHTLRRSRL